MPPRRLTAFYVSSAAAALTLFIVVTVYGENTLKAPPKLTGAYQLDADRLPECLQGKSLQLEIQQSGTFLHGALRTGVGDRLASLSGNLQDGKLLLAGSEKKLGTCDRRVALRLEATKTGKDLQGQIDFFAASGMTTTMFTGKLASAPAKPVAH